MRPVWVFDVGELMAQQDELAVDMRKLQFDLQRIGGAGKIRLKDDWRAGRYVLQITATDPHTQKEPATASQWIDFEIVN